MKHKMLSGEEKKRSSARSARTTSVQKRVLAHFCEMKFLSLLVSLKRTGFQMYMFFCAKGADRQT